MFSCAHEALKKLAKDKRFIGSSKTGYLAVLHTWGSMMQYHPHLHLLIPGGALSKKKDQWIPSRQDLFLHTKPFSVIFKAKFMGAMKKARLCDNIDPTVWKKSWVVDSQAVGNGQNSIRYISRYLFRVAISNNRIKNIENNTITFSYKDRRKKKWKTMPLDAMEFIRRFLQHVLPKGFMKVRYYGFLNPNFSLAIEKIRELISIIQDVMRTLLPEMPVYKKQQNICKRCGQVPKFIAFLRPTTALPTPACRGPG